MNQQQKATRFLSESIIFLIFRGIIVGLIGGVVISFFRLSIQFVYEHILILYSIAHKLPYYLLIIFFLYLLIAIIVGRFIASEPQIKGSGIPQIEAELKGLMHLNWWNIFWKKFIAGFLAISSGLLLGREGPSIQLGAMVGKGISKLFKLPILGEKTLIASGAAAGIAAAFGAPIAGFLFIVEEVYHHFSRTVWIPTLAASLTADLVSKQIFGMTPTLSFTSHFSQLPLSYYWLYLIMGIICGFLAFGYEKIILVMGDYYSKLGKILHLPSAYFSAIALLTIIPLTYFLPILSGGGHELIISLPEFHIGFLLLIFWFVLRFIFCMISYGSGVPGGIFLPILSLGALTGATFGSLAIQLGLVEHSMLGVFVVAGMSAYFGAVSKAPLTAIVLVCEMVGDLSQLLPLAFITLISYAIMDMLNGAPIYEAMLSKMFSGKEISPSDNFLLLQWPVTEKISGKKVCELELPPHILITTQTVGGKKEVVSGSTTLYLGNSIDLIVRESDRNLAEQYLL